ncbi:MAG TPA: AMP-binding protein [Candidatus Dormibacteraeota bacterium]|nr:AMP-binding protein [Candidatus Dormibacteraeota bacterium]
MTLDDLVTTDEARARYRAARLWDDSTLGGRVAHWASTRPEAIAVVDDAGTRRTYAELDRDAAILAQHLSSRVSAGDVVSVQLPNCYHTVVAAIAVQKLSAVINPLLPGYRSRELQHVFATARPKAILTPTEYRGFAYEPMVDGLRAATGLDVHHVVLGTPSSAAATSLTDVLFAGHVDAPRLRAAPAGAVSELIFTSGTEASPKAIMHTEQTTNFSVRVAHADLGMTEADVVWMPSPVGHSTGFNYGLRMALYHGLTLVLQDQWSASTACELITREGCTYTLAATTFLKDLVEEAAGRALRLDSMRLFGCGGAPVPPELVESAQEQGVQVLRLYGSTEVLVGSWHRPGTPLARRARSDGQPMSHVDLQLRDADGAVVAPGSEGEIFTRGPNTCVGFFRDPARTAQTFSEGWVRSGDVAVTTPEGDIAIVGRRKEIIIRGGLNIAPREIEDMLVRFTEVRRAAVVGLPDERLGERAAACLVLRDGAQLSFATMVQRLRAAGIADYKLPERLDILADLPTTATGKVQKHEIIRDLLAADPAPRWDRSA